MTKLKTKEEQALSLYPNQEFWDNEGFIGLLDSMAQRYHCLPTDLLNLSIYEFSMNVAIITKVALAEKARRENTEPVAKKSAWNDIGIHYEKR